MRAIVLLGNGLNELSPYKQAKAKLTLCCYKRVPDQNGKLWLNISRFPLPKCSFSDF